MEYTVWSYQCLIKKYILKKVSIQIALCHLLFRNQFISSSPVNLGNLEPKFVDPKWTYSIPYFTTRDKFTFQERMAVYS